MSLDQHSHDHSHAPPVDFSRAFAIGVALNLGFVLVEAATACWPDPWPWWPMPATT